MKKAAVIMLLAIFLLSFMLYPIHVESNPVIRVPDDYPTIQEAIDAADSGDIIEVYTDVYYEALYINKSLTIIGIGTVVINGGQTVTTNYGDRDAVIFVENATDVSLENLDAEGYDLAGKNYGIIYEESSGTIRNCTVSPNTIGDMDSVAIGAWDGSDLTVDSCTIKNYGRIGVFYFNNCTGGVYNDKITGQVYSGEGEVCYGIEVEGAYNDDDPNTASQITIRDNEIYNHDNTYSPEPSWSSAGIVVNGWLGYYPQADSTVIIEENDIHDNYYGIEVVASSLSYAHHNNIYDSREYGVVQDPDYLGNNVTFDARFNWWGDNSGPNQTATNPTGLGDKVTDYVDYSPWLGTTFETTPRTYHVNSTGTIQEAIDDASPGDTIIVAAGTYAGAIVDKDVTISAAGAASIITSGVSYKTSSSLYTAFRLDDTADGSEIKGFTINCNSSEGFYFAVFSRNADNIIIDSLIVNDAIQGITNWGGSNWQITNNVLNNTEAAGGGGIAIFLGAYPPGYTTCSGNLIQNNTITATATAPDYTCPGISVSLDLRGAFDDLTGSEDVSNNQVLNNNIVAPGALNGVGIETGVIGLEGNETKITATLGIIHDNTIRGNTIDGADMGVYFYTVTNLAIEENEIKNCNEGIHIKDGSDGNTINYNNIFGNGVGINNTAVELVDARYNWWGSPCGPTASPPAGDKIIGKVDYEPWLIEPYPPPTPVETLLYVAPAEIEYWTLSYGETFTVDIKLDDVTELFGYEFKLYWNTTILDLVGIQIAPPWSTYLIAKNVTDEASGLYWLSVGGYAVPPFTGNTTLVTLTFKITYDPIYSENRTCKLDLADTKLSAPGGISVYHMVHDGKYSIYSTKPKVEVKPPVYTAHALGETFPVDIYVSNIVNLYNFTFKLSYNTTLLDATNLEIGPFLNPPIYAYKFMIDDADGEVYLWVWSTGGAPPANGNGVLATVTFKATKATTWTQKHSNILSCALNLHDTLLVTDTGIEVPHDVADGTYYYEPKPGDLDCDGYVGLTDLRIVAYYYDPAYCPVADLNEDGVIDIYDLTIVTSYYGEDC